MTASTDAPRVGHSLVARLQDKRQADRAAEALRQALEGDVPCRDALLSALGPHGVAAALPGLAWAWTQAEGLRLHRTGSTPARDAADAWIQQTAERLAQGAWPLRPEDCASGHERPRRAEAGEWTGAAAALDAEWGWNRLLAGAADPPDPIRTRRRLARPRPQARWPAPRARGRGLVEGQDASRPAAQAAGRQSPSPGGQATARRTPVRPTHAQPNGTGPSPKQRLEPGKEALAADLPQIRLASPPTRRSVRKTQATG